MENIFHFSSKNPLSFPKGKDNKNLTMPSFNKDKEGEENEKTIELNVTNNQNTKQEFPEERKNHKHLTQNVITNMNRFETDNSDPNSPTG